MPWVNDIINNLQIAIDSFWYNILMMLASLHWGLMRSFLLSGYTIQVAMTG
jgi:hypothetical protein